MVGLVPRCRWKKTRTCFLVLCLIAAALLSGDWADSYRRSKTWQVVRWPSPWHWDYSSRTMILDTHGQIGFERGKPRFDPTTMPAFDASGAPTVPRKRLTDSEFFFHVHEAPRRDGGYFGGCSLRNRLGFLFRRFESKDLGGRSYDRVIVAVPHWSLILLALLVAWRSGGPLLAARRARWRILQGLCPSCGYDLRANTGRCPECGAEIASCATSKNHGQPH